MAPDSYSSLSGLITMSLAMLLPGPDLSLSLYGIMSPTVHVPSRLPWGLTFMLDLYFSLKPSWTHPPSLAQA